MTKAVIYALASMLLGPQAIHHGARLGNHFRHPVVQDAAVGSLQVRRQLHLGRHDTRLIGNWRRSGRKRRADSGRPADPNIKGPGSLAADPDPRPRISRQRSAERRTVAESWPARNYLAQTRLAECVPA